MLRDEIPKLERALYGLIRSKVRDDAVASDLAQEVWREVFDHEDSFDPEKGTPWTFTKIWFFFVIRRYFEDRRDRVVIGTVGDETQPDGVSAEVEQSDRFGVSAAERRAATSDPADAMDRAREFESFLVAAMNCDRPPHERITFGFNRLEWRPQEVATELIDERLEQLLVRLVTDYQAIVPWIDVAGVFGMLRDQMTAILREVIRDKRTGDRMPGLANRIVGDTFPRDYCGAAQSPDLEIARWFSAVKRSALRDLGHFEATGPAVPRPTRVKVRA